MLNSMFNIFQHCPKQLHNFLSRMFCNSSASFCMYIPVFANKSHQSTFSACFVETSGACMHDSEETEIMNQIVQLNEMSLSYSNEHNFFRNQYLIPLKRMFGDRNVHKTFSALNLTIICIKPFTSNNRTFSSILLKC